MEITCPGCQIKFQVSVNSMIPDEDVIVLKFKTKSELVDAKTLAGLIKNMAELQVEIAKEMGFKVSVFIKSFDYVPPETTIAFTVCKRKQCTPSTR